MRHAERLAAAEGDVGDAGLDDAPREVERFVAAKLIAPGLVGAGLLAAGDAARAAAVGQLPGKKKGARYSSTERPGIEAARISGEADVRLRHHLLGDVLELGRFPGGLVGRRSTCRSSSSSPVFAGSIVSFMLAHFRSFRSDIGATDSNRHVLACAWRDRSATASGACRQHCIILPRAAVGLPRLRQRLRRRSAQTCGSAAATLTQPLGSTSSVAGGSREARAQRLLDVERNVAELQLACKRAASRASRLRGSPGTGAPSARACPRAARRCRCASAGRY